jgi:hypothetical protein
MMLILIAFRELVDVKNITYLSLTEFPYLIPTNQQNNNNATGVTAPFNDYTKVRTYQQLCEISDSQILGHSEGSLVDADRYFKGAY